MIRSIMFTHLLNVQAIAGYPKFHLRSCFVLAKNNSKTGCRRMLCGKTKAASIIKAELDLSEDNVEKVLVDARSELQQLFDRSVGITGTVELAELDGPYVKLRLKGRFWHQRSTVLARLAVYLQQRIPEILEVDIEDESQLDDSPENF